MLITLLMALAVPAPIREVTVHSGQARITRTATVTVNGTETVEFPPLPPTTDRDSIRLEAAGGGAEVAHIAIDPVAPEPAPAGGQPAVDGPLAEVDDLIGAASRQQAVFEQLAQVAGWKPELPGDDTGRARLDARGWRRALAFLDRFAERMHREARQVQQRLSDLRAQRERLTLDPGARANRGPGGGWRVVAVVGGRGPTELRLHYLVGQARWTPAYDVRLDERGDRVTVALFGLIHQESGEDWQDAALTFSTAMPAAITRLPRLAAWRIGETERFVPTAAPQPLTEAPSPPVKTPTAIGPTPGTLAVFVFDQAGQPLKGVKVTASSAPGGGRTAYTDDEGFCRLTDVPAGTYQVTASAPKLREVVQRNVAVRPEGGEANLVMEVDSAVEEVMVMEKTPLVDTARPHVKQAMDLDLPAGPGPTPAAPGMAARLLTLAPPPPSPPPRPEAGTAAALSGGHDVSFATSSREDVPSGSQRRIPLGSWTWKVAVERALYPALGEDSYLVAVLKSAADRPLPGGRVSIAVGDDPAGTATLGVVVPGQPFTLPLGVDRAIRAVRRVTVQTREGGLFWRDAIDRHLVTIEITNPHAEPAHLQVHDQVPLSGDQRVEVKLLPDTAAGALDPHTGAITWRLVLGPGASTTLRLAYELRRPKGQRLYQEEGR
jgi:hypothetical protein